MRKFILAALLLLGTAGAASAQSCGGLSVNPVGFSPVAYALESASPTSSSAALPAGTYTKVRVLNSGSVLVYVTLGGSSVTTGQTAGTPLVPGSDIYLAVGTATYIAVESLSGSAGVYVTGGN